MRRCIVVIALAGCGGKPSAPPDAMPRALDLDVTVGHDGIRVFPNASDLDNCPSASRVPFPQPGQFVTWEDVICPVGCISGGSVEIGETELALVSSPDIEGWFADIDVTQSPDAMLSIVGCGGHAHIPIGGLPAPRATPTVVRMDATRQIAVTWTTDLPAQSAVVVLSSGLWARLAHVESTSYTYDLQSWEQPETYRQVSVWAFSELHVADSPYGPIRIWPGDRADTYVSMIAP